MLSPKQIMRIKEQSFSQKLARIFTAAFGGRTPCSCLPCRSLISLKDGAARFQDTNTNSSMPNESMQNNGARPRAMDAAEGSILVAAPVADVYRRWLIFEDYPSFITAIKRVRKLDANHFIASLGFNGKRYETILELMLRVPERRLAWRTLADHNA